MYCAGMISAQFDTNTMPNDTNPTQLAMSAWNDIGINVQDMREGRYATFGCGDTKPDGVGVLVGVTRFFRHPSLYKLVMSEALRLHRDVGLAQVNILCAGGSVGAEAYSLSFMAHEVGLGDVVRIQSVDLSSKFTNIGKAGVYPRHSIPQDGAEIGLFEALSNQFVRIKPHYSKNVDFIGPMSFTDMPQHKVSSDITVSAMALMHTGKAFTACVKAMANVSRHALVVDDELARLLMKGHGFEPFAHNHPDNIKIWRRSPFTP